MFHEAFRVHVDTLMQRERLDLARIENPVGA